MVKFQPLSPSGPDLAKNFTHTGMGDPSVWAYDPPAAYPRQQVVGPGETLAIDLTPTGNEERKAIGGGNKLVGHIEMPELIMSRAAVEAQLKGLTTPELQALYADLLRADQNLNAKVIEARQEIVQQIQSNPPVPRALAPPAPSVGGAARDLSAEDAELDVVFPAVYINGVRQSWKIGERGPQSARLVLSPRTRALRSLADSKARLRAGGQGGRPRPDSDVRGGHHSAPMLRPSHN